MGGIILKYNVILFDADETLFDFRKSESFAFRNTMLDFKMEYDENYHLKTFKEVNSVIWKEFEEGLITQEKLRAERFRRFAERLNTSFDAEEFSKFYSKHLASASYLYDESIGLIEELYKSYKLVIITNGLTDIQNSRIRKSVIGKYFEDIIISEEVQVAKPNPKIFELALNNIKHTDKGSVLMVGDSLSSDIQGGINFGIDTCWLNSNKMINNTGLKPTYEISCLKELKDVLEK